MNRKGIGLLKKGLFFIPFVLFFAAFSANAQNVGKISAKVVDAKTGEALVRATVQIVETKQGAFTKDNGIATVINVQPSENYTVVAKYAGYQPQTLKGVKVQSDITTELTFKLGSSSVDTIVVRADKLVEKTKTDVSTKISSSTIVNTPGRQNIEAVAILTPGLVRDNSNGGISINGSRGNSNSIKLNNVETKNILNGQASALQTNISKFAVSEINVITAGADASQGNMTGGVIATTTKAGGENMEFQFHYRQEIPALFGSSTNGYKQMAQNQYIYEFALGGPVMDGLKYYITGRAEPREFNNFDPTDPVFNNRGLGVKDPAGLNAGQLPYDKYLGRGLTGKLTFNAFGFNMAADVDYASTSQQFNGVGFYGDPANLQAENDISTVYSLNGQSQVGEGIINFNLAYTNSSDNIGKYDHSQNASLFQLYKIYKPEDKYFYDDITHQFYPGSDGIVDIYTPVSRQIPDPSNPGVVKTLTGVGINPITGHIEGGAITTSTNNPYGLLNTFVEAGNVGGYTTESTNQYQVTLKYDQQIGQHLLNAGFEGHFYDINRDINGLPWDANPFRDSFAVKPYMGALYVVDKMEFSDITFNPSLRFDFYNPDNNRQLTDPKNPYTITYVPNSNGGFDTVTTFNVKRAPLQTQVSPRLGITYAVTEKTTFNFNYGYFFNVPSLNDVLANTGGDLTKVFARGNQIVGNGGLNAERSKQIDVGFTTALTDDVAFGIQGVYKDLRNQPGLQRITGPNLPIGYTLYSDDQYGNARSIQFTLDKRMSNNFSAKLDYTYGVAKGTSSSATENYSQLIGFDPNSENAVLPLQPFYLSFDRTHVAHLSFNLNYGRNEGPTLLGVKALQQISFALTTEYLSGTPYTRTDDKGRQIGEYNADRNPDQFTTDVTLQRTLDLGNWLGGAFKNSGLDIQLEVTNLFNSTTPVRVYTTTGQGDDDGSNGIYTGSQEFFNDPTNTRGNQLDQLGQMYYNPRWDLNHDGRVSLDEQQKAYTQYRSDRLARRTNYTVPRRAYLNLSLRF